MSHTREEKQMDAAAANQNNTTNQHKSMMDKMSDKWHAMAQKVGLEKRHDGDIQNKEDSAFTNISLFL